MKLKDIYVPLVVLLVGITCFLGGKTYETKQRIKDWEEFRGWQKNHSTQIETVIINKPIRQLSDGYWDQDSCLIPPVVTVVYPSKVCTLEAGNHFTSLTEIVALLKEKDCLAKIERYVAKPDSNGVMRYNWNWTVEKRLTK
jgi:hypothetical protein